MLLVAFVLCCFGVGALYASWSGRLRAKGVATVAGWGLITASVVASVNGAGWEYGTAYAILTLPLVAWLFVLGNSRVRESRGPVQAPIRLVRPPVSALVRHGGLFLAAMPLAAVASISLVLLATSFFPWQFVDRAALAILVVPLLWGVLAYRVCATPRPARSSALLAGAAVLSSIVLLATR